MRRLRLLILASVAFLAVATDAFAAKELDDQGRRILKIQTVPTAIGVKLTYKGSTYFTDRAGRARIPYVDGIPIDDVRGAIVVAETKINPRTKVSKDRWEGGPDNSTLGLRTYRLVKWRFIDLDDADVDLETVESATLKASTGQLFTFTQGVDSDWLLAQRTVLLAGGVQPKDLLYSLQAVMVRGQQVVNASQQRFKPTERQDITFQLSFYPLTIVAKDALFGRRAGTSAHVTFPDGRVDVVPLRNGEATLTALPRGVYQVKIEGGGYTFITPVSVSRPQVADFPVVTTLDLVAGASVLGLIALGLIAVGRPHLFRPSTYRELAARARAPRRPRARPARRQPRVDQPALVVVDPPPAPPPSEPKGPPRTRRLRQPSADTNGHGNGNGNGSVVPEMVIDLEQARRTSRPRSAIVDPADPGFARPRRRRRAASATSEAPTTADGYPRPRRRQRSVEEDTGQ